MSLSVEMEAPPGPTSRGVSWLRVVKQQDYGSWISTIVIAVALAITQALLGGPRDRPFLVTDATISYPHNDSTVPYWLAIVVSLAGLVLSILVAELWLGRSLYADATDALAVVIHFLVDGISAFIVTGLATTVIKMVVGRLRPDFLDRCQPAIPSPLTTEFGQPPADNPVCQAAPSGELTDGHYSFPSGHTSTVFVFSVWTAAYCTWAFNMRMPRKSARTLASRSLGQRLLQDVGAAAGCIWIFAVQAWAWGVGVSRITDFKHHPSDMISGAVLGSLLGAFYVWRAIARVDRVAELAAHADVAGTPCASLLNNRVHHQADSTALSYA